MDKFCSLTALLFSFPYNKSFYQKMLKHMKLLIMCSMFNGVQEKYNVALIDVKVELLLTFS